MIIEYQQLMSVVYNLCHWPFLLLAFLMTKESNIKWALLLFILAGIADELVSIGVKEFKAPGWIYHVAQVMICYAYVRTLIIYRCVISRNVGQWFGNHSLTSWICNYLPSVYQWQIYPAELAIRRVFIGFVFVHLLALSHYVIYAAGLGWTATGGLFNQLGLSRTVIWDTAFVLNAILNTIELLLLFSLLCSGIKRLTIRA